VDHYRSRKNKTTVPIADEVAARDDPHEYAVRCEERRNLWDRARALPRKQYDALWLRYAEDMSVKDVARTMGLTLVHVKVLLYRARVRLAREHRLQGAGSRVPAQSEGALDGALACRSARNTG
jgi:RNA polymerase sigma-70 factor (ECF subfamily)